MTKFAPCHWHASCVNLGVLTVSLCVLGVRFRFRHIRSGTFLSFSFEYLSVAFQRDGAPLPATLGHLAGAADEQASPQ